jgi:hypothetical protein
MDCRSETRAHDPFYAAKLKQAQEDYAVRKRDFEEKEAKAKADPQAWAIQAVYSANFMCDVPKAEEWAAKYTEFHRDGHWPPLVLADTCAACGQPEKAHAIYRDVVARYEKWVNSDLTTGEAMQVQEQMLFYLDLLPELDRMHAVLATLSERDKVWWRVKIECEDIERNASTPQVYARHINALIRGQFPGYQIELNAVFKKAITLDPKFLDEHPDFKPYYKPEPKQ